MMLGALVDESALSRDEGRSALAGSARYVSRLRRAAALRVAACKKHYLVTSDMKNITLTSAGRNLVNFALPKKAKKSA
jgi:hypothetical protein